MNQNSSNSLVIKSNNLIEASYKLTTGEQKLILMMASMVKKEDTEFNTYQIKVSEFMDLMDVKNKSKYREIDNISTKLMNKSFLINKGESLLRISWLSSAEYFPNKGTVELAFDPKLKPYLLKLKSNFTKYQLKNINKLKSFYSIRIFELLQQYRKLGERTFEIDDLKRILCIEDKYKRYNDFKKDIIKRAQKELKENTEIEFEFEEFKTGRKITKIKFVISDNKDNMPASDRKEDENQISLFDTNKQYKIIRYSGYWIYKMSLDEAIEYYASIYPKNVITKFYKNNCKENLNDLSLFLDYIDYQSNEEPLKLLNYFIKHNMIPTVSKDFVSRVTIYDKKRLTELKMHKLTKEQKEKHKEVNRIFSRSLKDKSKIEKFQILEHLLKEFPLVKGAMMEKLDKERFSEKGTLNKEGFFYLRNILDEVLHQLEKVI